MFSLVRDHLYSALFPQLCFCCRERPVSTAGGNSCHSCWAQTKIFGPETVLCAKCGKPSQNSAKTINCIQCKEHYYDQARSVGVYADALKAAVVGLKNQPNVSRNLGNFFVLAFQRSKFHEATLIVPVPLSKQRKMERGFNQSEVIAEYLSKRSRVPFDANSLVRLRHSPIHRLGMDEKARSLSVQNSFDVVRPKLIAGRNVLLVDDVLTTGATVSYCAKALKKAGASKIDVLTLARAA